MLAKRLLKIAMIVLLFSVAVPLTHAQDDELPALVVAQRAGFHPEGIEWDTENRRFLTSSFTEGTIFEIADNGTVTPFIEDEDLLTTLGIHIDKQHDRLLVTNSEVSEDPDAAGSAQLVIYDLNTGARLHLVSLDGLLDEGPHLANDVTTDDEGNAYVSDSLAPVIYKITPDGQATIFTKNEQFASETFGLNGIEYHPDGYLLIALTEPGALYKVPLDDPEAATEVLVNESFSPDGIILHSDGSLIVVADTFDEEGEVASEVLALASDDDWNSATIRNRAPTDPAFSATSVTLRDSIPYVVYSHFNELFSGQSVGEFEILRIDFE